MNIFKKSDESSKRGKVFAITSGKGGVGKTTIAINLAMTFSRAGLKVLLIDADMGLANIDLITRVTAAHTIEEVVSGEVSIFDALTDGPENVTILPASSGLGEMGQVGNIVGQFKSELKKLENAFDMIFIDTGAGISANVVDFVFMADEVLIVLTPELTAFADAYAMAKLVTMKKPDLKVGMIVNIVQSEQEGETVFTKFNEIAKRFLDRETVSRGCILRDKAVSESVMRQVPLAIYAPKTAAMQSMRKVARNILGIKKTKKKSIFSR